MAKTHPHITDDIRDFIQHQKLFFVASAPLSADGHVNLSPKGHDCLRVLSSTQVAYLDRTGSGNETSAHVLENGRITLMWCAFDGPPNILRLYGRGRIVLPTDAEWATLTAQVVFLLPGNSQLYLNVFYILIAGPDSLLRVISKIAADLYELLLLLLLLPRELVYLLNGLRCLLLEIFQRLFAVLYFFLGGFIDLEDLPLAALDCFQCIAENPFQGLLPTRLSLSIQIFFCCRLRSEFQIH